MAIAVFLLTDMTIKYLTNINPETNHPRTKRRNHRTRKRPQKNQEVPINRIFFWNFSKSPEKLKEHVHHCTPFSMIIPCHPDSSTKIVGKRRCTDRILLSNPVALCISSPHWLRYQKKRRWSTKGMEGARQAHVNEIPPERMNWTDNENKSSWSCLRGFILVDWCRSHVSVRIENEQNLSVSFERKDHRSRPESCG